MSSQFSHWGESLAAPLLELEMRSLEQVRWERREDSGAEPGTEFNRVLGEGLHHHHSDWKGSTRFKRILDRHEVID